MTTVSSRTSGSARQRRVPGAAGPVLVVVVLLVAMVGLAIAMETTSYDVWGGFWVGPVLLLLTVPLANHVAHITDDVRAGRLVMTAAVVKVIGGSIARYATDYGVYGNSDATGYHNAGAELAPLIRTGTYGELGKVTATRFTEIVTGHVYAVIGPTRLGGFMVFSFMAFIGIYLFWRAFCIAVPEGDHRRYALLVFFFPTMLLWTSGLGKDAWMLLCLGAAAWGLAMLLTGRLRGGPVMVLALWGAAAVRPHLVLIFAIAAAAAIPIRLVRVRDRSPGGGIRSRVVLIALVAIGTVIVIGQAEEFFGLDELDVESAESVTDRVSNSTSRSGSTFEASSPSTPVGYARAAVTVVFRPFPFEASNLQSLLASAEGVALLVVIYFSIGRLGRLPAAALRVPYLMSALVYVATFIYAFAAIANFGILARQRAQLLPMLFVLISLPAASGSRRSTTSSPASGAIGSGVGQSVE